MTLKHLRLALWLLVGVVALAATGLYAYTTMTRPTRVAGLGQGAYQLSTTSGEAFTAETLKGAPSMVFFGFTHCPEVCPTSLAEMTTWYEALGDEAKDLRSYFVTVDPERDTAEIVDDYVSWTGHVIGVTGSLDETAKATSSWGVYAEKVPLDDGDYTMDHTASIFLVNAEGEFEGTIAYREDKDTAIAKLQRLLSL